MFANIILLTLTLSFVITALLNYMFSISIIKEQIYLYIIISVLLGAIFLAQYKFSNFNIDNYSQNLIKFTLISCALLLIFKLCLYLYEIGNTNITTYFIIGFVILILFILFCLYKINSILDDN
jgi:hypothetical protein